MEFSPITAYIVGTGTRTPAGLKDANALFFNKNAIAKMYPDRPVDDTILLMARKLEFMGNAKASTKDASEVLVYKDAPKEMDQPNYVVVPTI